MEAEELEGGCSARPRMQPTSPRPEASRGK